MKHLVAILLCLTSACSLPSSIQVDNLIIPFDYNLDNPLAHLDVHPLVKPRVIKPISGRIIDGFPARAGDIPYQVALYLAVADGTAHCAGALISSNWVLTVAHCTQGVRSVTAYLGSTLLSGSDSNRVIETVSSVIPHSSFSGSTLANDIALIRLGADVPTTGFIRPIPVGSDEIGSGITVTASGWGTTVDTSDDLSNELNYVNLISISNVVCQNTFGNIIQEGILCARGATTQSPCRGDSGAPLVTGFPDNSVLVGIVSFGSAQGCASGAPSGTTRISAYRGWISSNSGV